MAATENMLTVYEAKTMPPSDVLSPHFESIHRLLQASVAPATRRAYILQIKRFLSWCETENIPSPFPPPPPETLAAFIANLSDQNIPVSTVNQVMAAIAAAHKTINLPSPTDSQLIRKLLKGYRREHGTAPKQKAAATVEIVRSLLAAISKDNSPKHIRDRAIIALGFAGAFRRSELSALNVDDLKWTLRNDKEILVISVRRSKTDQEGQGMTKAIFPGKKEHTSPTALLKRWLDLAGNPQDGPLFREILKGGHITDKRLSAQSIRLVVKRAVTATGLSLDISAHSLRSGFVTTAIRQGKTERSIQNQTGHKSILVLRGYFQREDAIEDNAAKDLI